MDINQTPNAVGGTTTYANNTMKVTKGQSVSGFDFYIHSLPNGGPFTVSRTIKFGNSTGNTATLPEANDIKNVYEVYYYKQSTKGALKIKTSSDTKIFYNTTINNGSTWTKYTGTNLPAAASEPALNTLVNQIKDQVEIKLEKNPRYKSTPDGSGTITVSPVNDNTNTYKGFKHYVGNSGVINRITIHGQAIPGISELTPDGHTISGSNGGVYVYFSKDGDDYLQRPYLICLSPSGDNSGNTWYKRTGSPPYTWSDANGTFSSFHPNKINELAGNLTTIKGDLDNPDPPDTGYTIFVDRNDDLPNEQGSEASVFIHIDKNTLGYTNDETGEEITNLSDITAGKIKVYLKNSEPKVGFTRYMHKVKGANPGQYKKMASVTYKNETGAISTITAASNVKYVHVYYGGTGGNIPLLICVCTNNGSGSDTFKYYAPQDKPSAGSINWSPESITAEPTKTNNEFLVHLDKLNDWAENKTVIHIDKTNEKGTIPGGSKNKIYKTGSRGNTTITVSKTEGVANRVPADYVRYRHSFNAINNPTFKHNGIELTFDTAPSGNVTAVYVYYSTNDAEHEFPLIVCVKKSDGTHPYYERGNKWTQIGELDGQDPEMLSNANFTKLKNKLGEVKVKYEVKLEKSASYGFNNQINVVKNDTSGITVDGYNYYKHQKGSGGGSNTFKIEKVRHNGNVVGGFPATIPNVTEVNVYYKDDDSDLNKPLLLYTKTGGGSTNYTIYGKGKKWWNIKELNAEPTTDELQRHLEMLLYRQGTFK